MKSFIFGVFGFIVAMMVYTILTAQYSDYIAESQISSWCMDAQETIKEINNRVSKTGDLSGMKKSTTSYIISKY